MTRLSEKKLAELEGHIEFAYKRGFNPFPATLWWIEALVSEVREHRSSRHAGEADAEAGSPTTPPPNKTTRG